MRPTDIPLATSSRDLFHDAEALLRVLHLVQHSAALCLVRLCFRDLELCELSWDSCLVRVVSDVLTWYCGCCCGYHLGEND